MSSGCKSTTKAHKLKWKACHSSKCNSQAFSYQYAPRSTFSAIFSVSSSINFWCKAKWLNKGLEVKGVTINQYEGRTEGCNKGVIAPLLYQPISVTCSATERANYLFLRRSPKNVGSVKCWHQLGIVNVLLSDWPKCTKCFPTINGLFYFSP